MTTAKKDKKPRYYLNPDGEFVIENYNLAKPFANFFPGIAGKYGIPMWVFYVNRAQGISSFGTRGKGHAILEFFPANKAWQMVSSHGFRTFIKLSSAKENIFYEPFHNGQMSLDFNLINLMRISSYGLTIEENNLSLGLKIKVEYFNIPNDSYAGLARIVTIKNLSRKEKSLQLLDGLPQIVPFGTNNLFLKQLGRTIEAWMQVDNLENDVPFYKLDVDPTDRPEVIHIQEGHFYLGFHFDKKKSKIIRPIVDPQAVFGPVTDFSLPRQFLAADNFQYPKKEITQSKMPSGLLLLNLKLRPNQEKVFYTVVGYMRNLKTLNSSLKKITAAGYLLQKKEENRIVIQELQSDINTESSSKEFNLYAKQTYLDNIMRGGYPVVYKFGKSEVVFYLYSRKHGDPERDYNRFVIQPTYLSQGNGNYRDTNQNRRSDVWFNPQIKDENLIYFFNLLQTDGFNPLIVKGANFIIKDQTYLKVVLKDLIAESQIAKLSSFLSQPFTPGSLILFVEENKIRLKISYDEMLKVLLSHTTKIQEAEHKEGFWTDHWAYNLDLLESYLGLYPEKLKTIVFEKKEFSFYDNAYIVKPRHEKYLRIASGLRQFNSVVLDEAKLELINQRPSQPYVLRKEYGRGEIYHTTLINKLFCLLVNKLASLDPFGCGIEMEANKPNWYDALNGLPALFGSSINETFQLKRLLSFIKQSFKETRIEKIYLSEEIYDFLIKLDRLIEEYLKVKSPGRDYQYWDKSYSLKENYRDKTKFGLSGKEQELGTSKLMDILENASKKVELAIFKAKNEQKDTYTGYFINEVKESQSLNPPFIKPLKFAQKKLPLFLEAQVHALRGARNLKQAKKLYRAVKASGLYDKKLKMYKVTEALKDMPEEIGRCRIFTPGWLENESIWLHMEYKYLLELLKNNLYAEFYADFKNILIPFQKPQNYGRSILENSSFLVSSAFPDKNLHGNGFVARLSGSTAEFLQIWLVMNVGHNPFILDNQGRLTLQFKPILAGWLFDRNGNYAFNFLSKIRVVYHNPKRKDTFGRNAVKIKKIVFNDKELKPLGILSDIIPSPFAEEIRNSQVKRIDIYLG